MTEDFKTDMIELIKECMSDRATYNKDVYKEKLFAVLDKHAPKGFNTSGIKKLIGEDIDKNFAELPENFNIDEYVKNIEQKYELSEKLMGVLAKELVTDDKYKRKKGKKTMTGKIEMKALEEGLNELTGHHFEMAEKQERMTGNVTPDLSFSKSFQARLAAFALKMNAGDLKALPLKEYSQVTQKVSNFLFSGSDEAETAPTPSESAPST